MGGDRALIMEKKQLLYIITSVGLALILFIVGALWLLSTKKQTASSIASVQTPGTISTGTPEAGTPASTGSNSGVQTQNPTSNDSRLNPTEWVKNPQTVQGLQQPPAAVPASRGDVIIVYGDNTVTSKATGTVPNVSTDPNGVVIQVTPPQGTVTTNTPAVAAGTTGSNTSTTQSVETTSSITQTKTVTATAPKAATPTPAGTATPKSTAKSSTPKVYTDYWVQTGAYSTKTRAEAVKEQLKTRGITSILDIKEVNGKTYYRVRIGPYTTQKEAQYWLSLVKNIDGFSESYISTVQVKR
jgi:DedD protein